MFKKLFLIFLVIPVLSFGQKRDYTGASIYLSDKKNELIQKAVEVLQEEIQIHPGVRVPLVSKPGTGKRLVIIGIEEKIAGLPVSRIIALKSLPATGSEGFKIVTPDKKSLIIAGHDERGVIYSIVYLLRKREC